MVGRHQGPHEALSGTGRPNPPPPLRHAIHKTSAYCPDCGLALTTYPNSTLAHCTLCDTRLITIPLEERLASIEQALARLLVATGPAAIEWATRTMASR